MLETYATHHPKAADIGLVIEVADSTLEGDRIDKARIYAEAGIAHYWIVNLVDRQVEVYTFPSGSSAVPSFGRRKYHPSGDQVILSLDAVTVAGIPVTDLLP